MIKNGKLKKTITFSPSGMLTSNFEIGPSKWSRGKLLISKKDTINKKGIFVTTTKTNIQYGKFNNLGFPKSLISITKLQSMDKNKKMRTIHRKTTQMNFRNYLVNQGIAKKYISNSNKKK